MSVPFGFHAVGKVRENMKKGEGFSQGAPEPPPPRQSAWYPGQAAADLLHSYSSKLMKAIWGEYNRYSVHNFKSNQALPGVLAAQPRDAVSGAERAAEGATTGLLSSQ